MRQLYPKRKKIQLVFDETVPINELVIHPEVIKALKLNIPMRRERRREICRKYTIKWEVYRKLRK